MEALIFICNKRNKINRQREVKPHSFTIPENLYGESRRRAKVCDLSFHEYSDRSVVILNIAHHVGSLPLFSRIQIDRHSFQYPLPQPELKDMSHPPSVQLDITFADHRQYDMLHQSAQLLKIRDSTRYAQGLELSNFIVSNMISNDQDVILEGQKNHFTKLRHPFLPSPEN